MSQLRRQSIISSGIVYIGFAIGLLNTYLFTKEGGFTPQQYGLTNIFIAIATIMQSFANLGMSAYIYKFYPYYKDNLENKKNDLFTWALLVSLIGFCCVVVTGIFCKDLVIRKFSANSSSLVTYYNWVFPFGLGFTLFSLLEAYAWQLKKSVLTNFLKEVQFRLFTTILIILVFTGIITKFDLFIKLYSFIYLAIAAFLIINLIATKQLHITFSPSIVSKKFFKKILTLASFVYGGSLVYAVAGVFDTIVIASVLKDGLALAGVYSLAQNMASLIQAPQRGIVSSSVAVLSRAWKDKQVDKINTIYHRSSINMLVFAVAAFSLIWLNFTDGVFTFKLQHQYLDARWVFFFIGLMKIVDMGTGVNAQIIGTSTFWRFEFFTGITLIIITLPLNYFLTKKMGIVGPAIANLISFTIYNAIRYFFLLKKFILQPFTKETIYTILLGIASFYSTHFLFNNQQGFIWLVVRSLCFIGLYGSGTLLLKLSPDIMPVWQTILKKIGIKKEHG
jgi:O-antigen/teichoic acid export membrane protein